MKYLGTPVKLTHHNQPAPGPMAGGCFSWASPWGITEWPPYPEGKGNPGWGQDRMQTRCPGALSNPKMYCWWFTLYFISLCQHLEEFSLKVWISSFLYKKKKNRRLPHWLSAWRIHPQYTGDAETQEMWVWSLGQGKMPCKSKWPPPPVFLPGKSHGQINLAGYSPWGHKESDMTEHMKKQKWLCRG